MLDSYYRLAVPADLKAYYHVTDVIRNVDAGEKNLLTSDVVINRDTQGCISSVKYYTRDRELLKEIFYKDDSINKIDFYRGNVLYSTEAYKNGLLALKFVFRNNGYLANTYEYDYDKKGKIISICKKCDEREIAVVYKYDELERIAARKLYLNSEKILEQHYRYDILDRIKEYSDDNQQIIVNKVSRKNELLSYVIIDRMGNKVTVENHFTIHGYTNTEIIVNGHSTTVKDTSYVDNIMLKKPYATEDDLDLIIANLFGGTGTRNSEESSVIKSSFKKAQQDIEPRILPISIRKRLLYNNTMSKTL